MRLPSVAAAQHKFSVVPGINIERSRFDRSHGYKTTFDEDYLVPVLVDEVLPGDTFNCRGSFFARLATPLKPIMDNMRLTSFFFFVPTRLLWDNWEKFNGSQVNPGDSTVFTVPTVPIPAGGAPVGTLHNYMGVPAGAQIAGGFNVCAFYSRAYNRIYNEWFRDENQQNSVTFDHGDGPDTLANYVIKKRGKRFDYFTACLPWPQKGSAVTLAPVVTRVSNAAEWVAYKRNSNTLATNGTPQFTAAAGTLVDGSGVDPTGRVSWDPVGGLVAQTTINELRLAEQTQVLLERDARGGTRYIEMIKSHFGVTNPDFRLQRSEYLGGAETLINVHPVANTTKGDGTTAGSQGNLAAFGTVAAQGHGFTKSFTEHGVIIGLVCVTGDVTYQQGLERFWSRSTRYDYFWPALAHIGEQAVTNKEIFIVGGGADATVFGYIPRYDEYRYKPSRVTGKLASDYGTTLDYWHLSQRFTGAAPVLGDTFITAATPLSRCVAVSSEPRFIMDAWFDYKCARPMPTYGVPGLGSRF